MSTGEVQALGTATTGDHRQRIKSLRGKMVVFNREVRNSGKHVSYEEAPRLNLQTQVRMPTRSSFPPCAANRIFRIPKHADVHAVCFLAIFVEDGGISNAIRMG